MNQTIKNIARCGLFIALIAVFAQLLIPLPYVPLNLALLAVHLTGLMLKPKYAILTVLGYILAGSIGLPVFAQFNGGLPVLLGPTGGFILGYLLDAMVISIAFTYVKRTTLLVILFTTLGTLVCYSVGLLWFMQVTGLPFLIAVSYCVTPFILGDALKIGIVTLLNKRIPQFNQ